MSTLGRGTPRWARAGLLALLTVLLSLGSHALAGGQVHLSVPLVLGGAALGAVCVAAADVRRGFVEVLAVVLLAQPVLHLLASLGGHGTHAGHGASRAEVGLVAGAPVSSAHVTAGVAMLLAHAAAALVASVLLADAERAVWALVGLFTPVAVPTARILPVACPPRLACRDRRPTPLVPTTAPAPVSRRGPPVVLGAH